jgi:hypothetical protein
MRFVEFPFRRKSVTKTNVPTSAVASLLVLMVVISAAVVYISDGLPSRVSPKVLRLVEAEKDSAFITELKESDIPNRMQTFGLIGAPSVVFVWGDSHAMAILPAVDAACKTLGISGLAATASSTFPVLDWSPPSNLRRKEEVSAYNCAVMNYLRTDTAKNSIDHVVLAAMWYSLFELSDNADALNSSLTKTVHELQLNGYKVTIFKNVPIWPTSIPKALALGEMLGWGNITSNLENNTTNNMLKHSEEGMFHSLYDTTNVQFIDPIPFLSDRTGKLLFADDGGVFFRDKNHLSVYGALKLQKKFEEVLEPR